MKFKDMLVIGAIGGASLLSSCQSDKEQCIESGKIEQVNALVTKPDSLQSAIKDMSEDDVVALLKCSNLFDPGDQNRVHAVVLQEIGKNFSPEKVNKRPKEVRKYLAYMNIFSLEQLGLNNEDMPRNSAYEKARFGNVTPKELIFDNTGFFNIKNQMLVIVANEGEKHQFESNLGHNWKEIKRNKSTRNGITKFGHGQTIQVASAETIKNLPKGQYGIIQIKGHTGDMSIIEQVKPFIQENATIIILGGCNSELYTENVLQAGGIPITNKGLGEGTHNDHISIQLLKEAKTNPTIQGVIEVVRNSSKISSKKFNFPDAELTQKINGAIDN